MNFNKHFALDGQHALLSASKYSWLNYSEEQIERLVLARDAAARGTRFHKLAAEMILMKVKPRQSQTTFNMYVNDAIGYRMTPEVVLFYSLNAFGTADAISFRKNILRVSDLKMGSGPTSFKQLLIYCAFFCLEYKFTPFELERMELRIYQNDEIRFELGDAQTVSDYMELIKRFDKLIESSKEEALL